MQIRKRSAISDQRSAISANFTDFFYLVIIRLLGLLLLAASLLKAHQQAALFRIAPGSLERWLSAGAVALELSLGLWLSIGFHPRLMRSIAGSCLAIFLIVSVAKGFAGEVSCGCFGAVPVNPWITAGIDGFAVLALLLARPGTLVYPRRKQRLVFGLLSLLILGSGAWWIVGAQAARLDGTSDAAKSGSMILIDAKGWMGQRLPLLPHINIGERLQSGDWLVVLYRRDCRDCHEQLPALFAALGRANPGGKRRPLIALIEVPSESSQPFFFGDEKPDAWGKLPAGPQWIVQTPLFLRTRDGIVRGAAHTAAEALRFQSPSRER